MLIPHFVVWMLLRLQDVSVILESMNISPAARLVLFISISNC